MILNGVTCTIDDQQGDIHSRYCFWLKVRFRASWGCLLWCDAGRLFYGSWGWVEWVIGGELVVTYQVLCGGGWCGTIHLFIPRDHEKKLSLVSRRCAISLRGVVSSRKLRAVCLPRSTGSVLVRAGRIGEPNVILAKCASCFSPHHVRVLK